MALEVITADKGDEKLIVGQHKKKKLICQLRQRVELVYMHIHGGIISEVNDVVKRFRVSAEEAAFAYKHKVRIRGVYRFYPRAQQKLQSPRCLSRAASALRTRQDSEISSRPS